MGFNIHGRFGHGKIIAMQLQVEILTAHPVARALRPKGLFPLIVVTGVPPRLLGPLLLYYYPEQTRI